MNRNAKIGKHTRAAERLCRKMAQAAYGFSKICCRVPVGWEARLEDKFDDACRRVIRAGGPLDYGIDYAMGASYPPPKAHRLHRAYQLWQDRQAETDIPF